MNRPSVLLLIALFPFSVAAVQSQSPESPQSIDPLGRPRVVTGTNPKRNAKSKFQEPSQTPVRPVEGPAKPAEGSPRQQPQESKSSVKQDESVAAAHRLSPVRIRLRIEEAERLMKVRVLPTAMNVPSIDYVTLAALLPETSHVHLIRIAKQSFLTRGAEFSATTSLGLPVQIHIVRANGVNTAVTVFDEKNRSLVPLVVEFPIERRVQFREMACDDYLFSSVHLLGLKMA